MTILKPSFEFKRGKFANYTAAANKICLPEAIGPYTGPKDIIVGFTIGLIGRWNVYPYAFNIVKYFLTSGPSER